MASICNLQIESVFDELLGGRRNIRSEWFNSPGDGVSYPVALECSI